jgi:hypothetical protein
VCDPSYSDRVPVMDGSAEVGKIYGNAGHKALDEFADQRRPVPDCLETAELGQPVLVEHPPRQLGRSHWSDSLWVVTSAASQRDRTI